VEREFKALVHEFSDATDGELAMLVSERLGVETSRSSVIRSLARRGFTLKKEKFVCCFNSTSRRRSSWTSPAVA